MLFDFLLIINLVALLYIWFDSEAFVEWAALLRLKFFKYESYAENKKSPVSMIASQSYVDFLLYRYGQDSFFVRLITCPICLSVWLNIILIGVFYSRLDMILLGPNIVSSWILYHALKWLLHKFNA